MAEHKHHKNVSVDTESAVVETRIVSPKGARVTETVFVLSDRAKRQLEIKGEVPALPFAMSVERRRA